MALYLTAKVDAKYNARVDAKMKEIRREAEWQTWIKKIEAEVKANTKKNDVYNKKLRASLARFKKAEAKLKAKQ